MFIRSFVRGFDTASGVSIIGHRVAQSGRDESKARVVRMYNFTEVAKDRADRILFRDSQDGGVSFLQIDATLAELTSIVSRSSALISRLLCAVEGGCEGEGLEDLNIFFAAWA